MLEEPLFWKLAGVCEKFDRQAADILYGFVELLDLGGRECIAVLLGVDLGVIENLVPVDTISVPNVKHNQVQFPHPTQFPIPLTFA